MVRTSVVQLVFFIAVLSVASTAVGVLVVETSLYAQAIEDEGERDVSGIDAEITIINDAAAETVYDDESETVTLYVKNVGGSTLEPDSVDVLLDGTYVEPAETTVLGDDEYWHEGRVLAVTIAEQIDPGDHRTQIVVDGAKATMDFNHRIAFWLETQDEATCSNGECTVDRDQETLNLTMGTEPVQTDESIEYTLNDTDVATFEDGSATDDGVTGPDGTNETTLELGESGTVLVSLDADWDEDEIVIHVVD